MVDSADFQVGRAVGAAPGSEDAAGLDEWIDGLDERRWPELLPELRGIAERMAPRYRDVLELDDVFGELAVLTYDRWLPKYRECLLDGTAPASLRSYLERRLERHLGELRRKNQRRSRLIGQELTVERPMFANEPTDPYSALVADSLVSEVAKDNKTRALIALRYAGFTQEEIAEVLEVSRPTVSRRIAVLAGAFAAAIVAIIALAVWSSPRQEVIVEIPPAPEPAPSTPSAPAGRADPAPPMIPAVRDTILIDSIPAHAEVYDASGVLLGNTPHELVRPTPGQATELVIRQSFHESRRVRIVDHTSPTVSVVLRRTSTISDSELMDPFAHEEVGGWIELHADPSVDVYEDGRLIGRTPMSLTRPGRNDRRSLELVRPGYRTRTITVSRFTQDQLHVRMRRYRRRHWR